jgi:hypothetical protein
MGRRGQSVTLSLSDSDKQQLIEIAQAQGMLWGDKPNISRLVEAIARKELVIGRNNDWSTSHIKALQQAMRALIDTGQTEEARIIAQILLARSEISIPLRHEIEGFLNIAIADWRSQLDQYIRRQQPFQLAYRDAADRPWTFHIRYARIQLREKRQYLECWCEETEGNDDLPELRHNRTLRLDRISEAALGTLAGGWRDGLDTIAVEMNLLRGLAFAYQARPEDVTVEWRSEPVQVRRVVRQMSSTFWLFREVLPYGKDCMIVSPKQVRDRLCQELIEMMEGYAAVEGNERE